MKRSPSRYELRLWMNSFLGLTSIDDFCQLTGIESIELHRIAGSVLYREFYVPKKNGEKRLIEDPVSELKAIQRIINDFLQGVYHFHRSSSAYGFLVSCSDDPPYLHRNIVNNARQHIGKKWMLNMDIEDFFHAVKSDRVAWIFLSKPFSFDSDLAYLLMQLTTYKGRLPMGAPTSPILSNFAAKLLDNDLETLSKSKGWVYSRYADDMSFSSDNEIMEQDIILLRDYYEAHNFIANEKKVKLMGPGDEHSVTGIVVGNKNLDLKDEFFEQLGAELKQLNEVSNVKGRLGVTLKDWVDDYRDRIEGMIVFAEFVLGERNEKVLAAKRELERALASTIQPGAYSWLDFPYF
jgi:RNA-directed DNA polymerase